MLRTFPADLCCFHDHSKVNYLTLTYNNCIATCCTNGFRSYSCGIHCDHCSRKVALNDCMSEIWWHSKNNLSSFRAALLVRHACLVAFNSRFVGGPNQIRHHMILCDWESMKILWCNDAKLPSCQGSDPEEELYVAEVAFAGVLFNLCGTWHPPHPQTQAKATNINKHCFMQFFFKSL